MSMDMDILEIMELVNSLYATIFSMSNGLRVCGRLNYYNVVCSYMEFCHM